MPDTRNSSRQFSRHLPLYAEAALFCPGLFPRSLRRCVQQRPAHQRGAAAEAALELLYREDDSIMELRRSYQVSARQAFILRRLIAARGRVVPVSVLIIATGERDLVDETLRRSLNRMRPALPVPIRSVPASGYALSQWRAVWPENCLFREVDDDPDQIG